METSETLVCDECLEESDEEAQGWIALPMSDVHGIKPDGVAIFCPECAAVEFGYRDDEQGNAS